MAGPTPRLRFGEFELDSKAAQLRRGPDVLALTGQPLRILELLVGRAGEVVTRDEIRDAIWPGDYNVDFEAAINVAVRKIREVLGESADAPLYLHTVRGRGYRFEVGIMEAPDVAAPIPSAPAAPPPQPAPTPQLSPPPPNRRLRWAGLLLIPVLIVGVIASSRNTAPGERQMVQFTHSGSVHRVAVNRDGTKIAYADLDKNEWVLRVCETASGVCQILLRRVGDVSKIVFSQDGTHLFVGYFGSNGLFPGSNIVRAPVAGGSPTLVVRNTGWLQAVSKDGRQVLFLRKGQSPNGDSAYIADVFGGNERAVVKRFPPDRITVAAWSPDEQTLACWWLVSNNTEYYHSLVTVRLADGAETVLSKGPWSGAFPRPDLEWLPDGSGLVAAIADSKTGRRQIYQIAYPSGAVERITNELASYLSLAPAGDMRTLVTVKDDTAPQMWILDPKRPESARQLTTGLPGYHSPAWTPQGILALGERGLWLIDPTNGQKQLVPGLQVDDKRPFGTPDGRTVYFESSRSGDFGVWKMGLEDRNVSQVTFGGNGGRPKISRDGKWMAYSGFAEDFISIWRVGLRGGLPIRISHDEAMTEPDFSPDGKWIAAAKANTSSLKVYPFSGGPAVKAFVLPDGGQREVFSWTPDSKGLTFRRIEGGVGNLWIQPLDGGEPTALTHFDSQEIPGFAWSPDGRLAITRAQRSSDVVLIRNFRR